MKVEDIKKEIYFWAEKIGVSPKEIHVREMKRKWASCSSRGRLTFDRALLNEPAEKRAEIIVHELLHLRYQNHGKLFRNLIRVYLNENR